MGFVSTLNGAEDAASLNLDFKNQKYKVSGVNKTFNDLITFTRASVGGRWNASGVYEVLPNNQPRFDYDPITKVLKGLLVEEPRTNWLTYSNDLSNAAWVKVNSTLNPSSAVSPEGLLNSDMVIENTVSTNHGFSRDITVVSGLTYTVSFFIKEAGRNLVRLRLGQAGGVSGTIISDANFDLNTTTFISGFSATSPTIVDVGSGWKRISLTAVAASATLGISVLFIDTGTNVSYAGNGVSGVSFYGMCVESGSFSTSYIPTPTIFTSRSSTATYFDTNGVIQTADVNVARSNAYGYDSTGVIKPIGLLVEAAATNMLTASSKYDDSSWTKVASTVARATEPDPTGTLDAWALKPSAGTGVVGRISKPYSAVSGTTYTLSVYAKKKEISFLRLLTTIDGTATVPQAHFDLSSLVTGSVTASTAIVTGASNEWVRCSITFVAPVTGAGVVFIQAATSLTTGAYTGDGTPSVILSLAQLETGTLSSYIPTPVVFTSRASTATYIGSDGLLQTAAVNIPRIDYDPVSKISKGLLVEAAATNLATYTTALHRSWAATYVAIVPYDTVSPDGTLTGARLVETIADNEHRLYTASIPVTSGLTYTGSIWVKAGSRRYAYLHFSNIGSWGTDTTMSAKFDTLTGTILAAGSAVIAKVETGPNGWFRLIITSTAISSSPSSGMSIGMCDDSAAVLGRDYYLGDGNSFIHIWGPQFEQGSSPTSYIPSVDTFSSRASTATYMDENGVLQTALSGVSRENSYGYDSTGSIKPIGLMIEDSRTNILTHSTVPNFVATWSTTGGLGVLGGQQAPDGSYTAVDIIEGGYTAQHEILRFYTPTSGFNYTHSVYIKKVNRKYGYLSAYSSSASNTFLVDLDTGDIVQSWTSGSIGTMAPVRKVERAGNGWWRLSLTHTAVNANNIYIIAGGSDSLSPGLVNTRPSYLGSGMVGVSIWGPQCEVGAGVTTYIPTPVTFASRASTATYFDINGVLQTAASGVARESAYVYDSVGVLKPVGLLLESPATNLTLQSNSDTTIIATRATYTSTGQLFVDGITPLRLLKEDNTVTSSHFGQPLNVTLAASTYYTGSYFVKAAGRTKLCLQAVNSGSWLPSSPRVDFDLTAGTAIGSFGATGTIQKMSGGIYRITITATTGASGVASAFYPVLINDSGLTVYSGDGSSGIYIGGYQIELGLVATSYIPTAGAAVTRAGDGVTSSTVTRAADVTSSAQVTRAADVYTSPTVTRAADVTSSVTVTRAADIASVNNLSPWLNVNEGTLCISMLERKPSASSTFPLSLGVDSNNYIGLAYAPGGAGQSGAAYIRKAGAGGSTSDSSLRLKVAAAWDATQFSSASDGTSRGTVTHSGVPVPVSMYIGRGHFGGSTTNNHIRDIKYYPLKLSNSTMEALTL
jgi:hypothetical protein